jgi:twitching motility protein PilT
VDISTLLKFMSDNKASDLHLSGGNPPIVRIDGELQRIKTDTLTSDQIRALLYSVMSEDKRTAYERDLEIDFAISFGEARFRVNAYTNRAGSAAVFRLIPSHMPTLEELHSPPVFRRLADLDRGLVLVTGPTGSGKSTTLAAMINHINETSARHILTIEDPVEFFHHSKMGLVNHREVGSDTQSFARALKSALREDPDVILVGEMRDHETIALALTAAETGHLVFGTLHSSSAAKSIDRIIDVFPAADKAMIRTMLSGSLQGIIAQILLPKIGGGRAAAHEIMLASGAIRNLIRENQLAQIYSMIQTGARFGMQTMADSISDLVAAGVVSKEDAQAAQRESTDGSDDTASSGGPKAAPGAQSGKKGPVFPAASGKEDQTF